jgi:two-component system LytT family response regulator
MLPETLPHPTLSKRIAIPTVEGFVFLPIQELLFCKAAGNYTKLHLTGQEVIVSSYTLLYFENLLATKGFIRLHKSYLANSHHICRYLRKGIVELYDGTQLEVSRTYRHAFLLAMKQHFEQ